MEDESYRRDNFNLLDYSTFTDLESADRFVNRVMTSNQNVLKTSHLSFGYSGGGPIGACGEPFQPFKQYRSDVCLWLECPIGLAAPRQPLGRFPAPPTLTLHDGFSFSTGFELFPFLPEDPFLGQVNCSQDERTTFDDNFPVNLRNNRTALIDTDSYPAMRVQAIKVFHPQDDPNIHMTIEWSEFFKEEEFRHFRDKYLTVKVQAACRNAGDHQLVTLGVMSTPLESGAIECDKCCHRVFSASGILCKLPLLLNSHVTQMQTYMERYSDDSQDQHPKYSVLIECKLTFSLSSSPHESLKKKVKSLSSQALKSQGLKMLTDQLYTDFTLICEGSSYPCHRSVLAGHSDAFSAMFQSKMKEEQSHQLILEDMSPSGVEALLGFLYYGDTSALEANSMLAVELLRTGEKYLIPSLKNICNQILLNSDISRIALPDAFAMFELGTMIKDCEALQDIAIKAFVKNSSDYINETKDLSKLFTANPGVAAFLFCKLGLTFAAFV